MDSLEVQLKRLSDIQTYPLSQSEKEIDDIDSILEKIRTIKDEMSEEEFASVVTKNEDFVSVEKKFPDWKDTVRLQEKFKLMLCLEHRLKELHHILRGPLASAGYISHIGSRLRDIRDLEMKLPNKMFAYVVDSKKDYQYLKDEFPNWQDPKKIQSHMDAIYRACDPFSAYRY